MNKTVNLLDSIQFPGEIWAVFAGVSPTVVGYDLEPCGKQRVFPLMTSKTSAEAFLAQCQEKSPGAYAVRQMTSWEEALNIARKNNCWAVVAFSEWKGQVVASQWVR